MPAVTAHAALSWLPKLLADIERGVRLDQHRAFHGHD
jgi:hypothetical protein